MCSGIKVCLESVWDKIWACLVCTCRDDDDALIEAADPDKHKSIQTVSDPATDEKAPLQANSNAEAVTGIDSATGSSLTTM